MQPEITAEIKDIDPNPRTKTMVKTIDKGMLIHKVEMVVIASFAEANVHQEMPCLWPAVQQM